VSGLLGAVWTVPGLQVIRNELTTAYHSADDVWSPPGEGFIAGTAQRFLRRRRMSRPLLAAGGLGATALMVAYARR